MMHLPSCLQFTGLFASLMLHESHAATAKPNVVLILADDLGWANLGCYGNGFNETPRIDRLAQEGVRFTQFYAGPVCSPTRANLQTGQDQARFGITQHIPGHRRPFAKLLDPEVPRQLPLEVETFAERLASSGYPTLLDLASAAPPRGRPLDGVSLVTTLRDPSAPPSRDALFWHLPHYHHMTRA